MADSPQPPTPAGLVRPLRRARLRAGQALHRLGRLRPAPRRRRHRGLARARPDARRGRRARRATTSPRSSAGMATIRGRDRARRVRLVARPRGRAPQHRAAAHRAGRRRRQAAAHRALAQRPGRHRHAAVAARRDRRHRPALARAARARCSTWPSAHADTIMPGFTHLQVAQPVTFGHHLLAYEAMLARDAERLADCRRRVNRLPLGAAALAGTSYPIDRERVARELGFDGAVRQLARRRLRPRLRDRIRRRRRAGDDAPVALRRGADPLDEPALRLRRRSPTASAPAARSCRRRRTPTCRSSCAARPARVVGHLVGAADADEGPAARLQQGQPGRQGAAVRHRRHAGRHAGASWPTWSPTGIAVDAERMRAAAREGFATATDLADYLVKQGPAVPRRARGGRARGAPRRGAAAATSPTCRWPSCSRSRR